MPFSAHEAFGTQRDELRHTNTQRQIWRETEASYEEEKERRRKKNVVGVREWTIL